MLLVSSPHSALLQYDSPDAPCVPCAPPPARIRIARVSRVSRLLPGALASHLDDLLDHTQLDWSQGLGVILDRVGRDGFIFRGAGAE